MSCDLSILQIAPACAAGRMFCYIWAGSTVDNPTPLSCVSSPAPIRQSRAGGEAMNADAVRTKIKEIIADVGDLDVAEIADDASFVEDLDLDSLSNLEIGVDVNDAFSLGFPEGQLQKLKTVEDAVQIVLCRLEELGAQGEVA